MNRTFALRFGIDGANRAVTVLITILLARVLGVEDFGKLIVGIAYANLLSLAAELGTHLVFLREFSRAAAGHARGAAWGKESQGLWNDFLGLKLALATAVALAGGALVARLWPWEHPLVPVALVCWMTGNSLVDFFHQACTASDRLDVSAWIVGFHRGLNVLLILAAVLLAGGNLRLIALAFGLSGLAGAALGLLLIAKRLGLPPRARWQPRVWGRWLRTTFPLAVGSLCASTHLRLGLLILPWFLNDRDVGLFGAAFKVFEAGYILPAAFVAVAVPHLSKTWAQTPAFLGGEIRRLGLFVLGMAALVLAAGEPLAGVLVRIAFGKTYDGASVFLRILLAANALAFVNYYFAHLLVVYNRLKRQAANEIIALAAGTLLTIVLVSQYGGTGAAWSLVGIQLLLTLLTLTALRFSLKKGWASLLPQGTAKC